MNKTMPVGKEPRQALADMECRIAGYDLTVVRSLAQVLKSQEPVEEDTVILELSVKELRLGQLLDSDIQTATGLLLVPAGTPLGLTHLEKLRNFARLGGIREPITVVTRR
jgi:hypothetical protein